MALRHDGITDMAATRILQAYGLLQYHRPDSRAESEKEANHEAQYAPYLDHPLRQSAAPQ
jgi:hypothetical protein